MGDGYACKCNKCDYSFVASFGVGFMFPKVYEENVAAMKSGEYGDQPKSFFEVHPDGAISCDNVVVRCRSCGEYDVMPSDLSEDYKLFQHYQHKCESCGGNAEIVEGFESKLKKGELKCPKCDGGVIKMLDFIMWD